MFENHKEIEFDNRKSMIIHFLQEINKRNRPVSFSDLALTNMPNGGLQMFESLIDEMESNKWIIVKKERSGTVEGMPHLVTLNITYSISVQGIEYLSNLGLIEDRHKIQKEASKPPIQNYGNMIIGKDVNGIVQGLDFENSRDNAISVNLNPNDQAKEPKNAPQKTVEEKKISMWNKIYKWTDHKLISMIIYAILGFFVALILKHFKII